MAKTDLIDLCNGDINEQDRLHRSVMATRDAAEVEAKDGQRTRLGTL